jgi:hypothetical protein
MNQRLEQATEYEMIDVNDFMIGMSNDQRYRYLLKMNEGLSEPIFSYTWSKGGSRAGVNPHVIWRVPLKTEKEQREQGLQTSQNNIDYLKQNTIIYRTRAERSAYLATVVKTNFISSRAAAQAVYEFITGDVMPKSTLSSEAIAAARFALNSQDPDIIVDLRKLNGRITNDLFDPFWAKMAAVVEGRVDDRRHGEYIVYLYSFLVDMYMA